LELAGLALGLIDPPAAELAKGAGPEGAMLAHEASNPLTAARASLQLVMESIGRWVDLPADRRLALLDDLGQVLEDIDRATDFLRVVQDRARGLGGPAGARAERFDAVRVVRSCLTLERRLLRDRGIDLDFTTSLESLYLKGDPNALFDLLVNLVRNAAEATAQAPAPVEVNLARKGRDLEVTVRDRGTGVTPEQGGGGVAKIRSVAERMFAGAVRVDSQPGQGTTFIVTLPLPPQREGQP